MSEPAPPVRRLLFAGEAIVDVAMRVPAFPWSGAQPGPQSGSGVLADSSRITVGGGFNVMAAAARQGLPVLYAGGHGTGPWGDLVRKSLSAEGIGVLRDPDPFRDTGFVVALTGAAPSDGEGNGAGGAAPGDGEGSGAGEATAERVYVTQLGAESVREPGCMDGIRVSPGDAVYISGYGLIPPDGGPVLAAWAASLPPGALLFLDPGHLAARIPAPLLDQVLPRCDWLSCTAAEATVLTGANDGANNTVDATRALLSRTRNVIVRLGPAGCLLCVRGDAPVSGAPVSGPVRVPAPAVTPVDTTGAGDTHAGAFLAALADGLPPEPAARRANAAAALSVTRPGPATAPTRPELAAWLR